jgi:hypothetical protein
MHRERRVGMIDQEICTDCGELHKNCDCDVQFHKCPACAHKVVDGICTHCDWNEVGRA